MNLVLAILVQIIIPVMRVPVANLLLPDSLSPVIVATFRSCVHLIALLRDEKKSA
jgi:hypothetical protein